MGYWSVPRYFPVCSQDEESGSPSQNPFAPLLQPGISSTPNGKPGDLEDRRAWGLTCSPSRPYRLKPPPQFRGSAPTSSPAGLVQEVPAGARPGTAGPSDVEFGISAFLADVNLGNIGFADFGTGEVDPGVAFLALDHGAPGEGFHAEAGDQVPRIVICQDPEKGVGVSGGEGPGGSGKWETFGTELLFQF